MRWCMRNNDQALPSETEINRLGRILTVSPLLVSLLCKRGLREAEEMDRYLSPGLRHLADPSCIPGLEQAAEALAAALEAGKQVAVWGDYDVDGVTSTAMVKEFLQLRGHRALHHIPQRQDEGYGLSPQGLKELRDKGVEVLLTVDCGITDTENIDLARSYGIQVIVTDHHLPGESLPSAEAICNPRLSTCGDPELADLAGVGVAFFLLGRVNRLLSGPPLDMRRFLDLVALGTLADVVPLSGQNRILAKNGLLLIAEAPRPGIAALKEACGFASNAALGTGQVTFGLAPRINAAGRVGDAYQALDLLLAPDVDGARPLARKLDALNIDRRKEEERILEQALEQAEEQSRNLGLVLYGPDWHQGVIGIVASRVVEAWYRPTLILCDENGGMKGSGRSISEFNLHAGLQECSEILNSFGGHRQAAGLSLEHEALEPLRQRFHEAVIAQIGETPLEPRLKVDAEIGFGPLDYTLLKELEMLQPFGIGNPEPVFASPLLKVRHCSIFGKKHVALDLTDPESGKTLRAKAWRMADKISPEVVGSPMRVAFSPKIDTYNGVASIDLRLKDWRIGKEAANGIEPSA